MPSRAEATFNSALERPPAEREAYLAQACGDDTVLLGEVRELLAAHEEAGDFLKPNSPEIEAELARLKPEAEGERIGRYKLLQEIGEGGFGTVWMAEQMEPVTRRVALKIIKLGMDTREVIARFEAERQALAIMDHPNIAKVLDAGATDKGRPFFVMELVKGMPITKYCDEAELGTRERLALFGDVCSAINHAHQKGVVHRDIKPSNVMITLYADKPVVKVIDFGIAKATQSKLTDKTLFTRFEQFIGTPVYMSPEQAALSAVDIDTRSDIYALGILLYELLVGKPPFDSKSLLSAGYEEMRRIIREVEPVKPSSRICTIVGDERTQLAKARHIEPAKVDRLVEPDLDWIVMKAIDKDRARRYETANAFAQDIAHFLADEPVSATPPSAIYLLQKLVRRHKLIFAAGSAVVAALVLGLSMSTWLYLRERAAHQMATKAAQEAEQANERAVRALTQVEAEKTATEKALAQTKIAKEAAEKAQTNEAKQREKAELEATVANLTSYSSQADAEAVMSAVLGGSHPEGRAIFYKTKLPHWREGFAMAKPALEQYPRDSRVRFQFLQILGALSNACFESGETAEARTRAKERLDANTDTKEWYYGNVISEANQLLGRAELREGHVKEAGGYLLKAGQTPGSPQLDSFGPSFALARELLAAGEKQVVLDYLDLVEKFMVKKHGGIKPFDTVYEQNAEFLQKCREDIRAGRTPDDAKWRR